VRIGTRGSELALWQARHVAARLGAMPDAPPTELVTVRTEGDLLTDVPLSQVTGKAFFTREIEEALLAGEIDLAVHSLKDLATALPPGLALGAVLARDDPRDALVVRAELREELRQELRDELGSSARPVDLDALPPGARVGTSSLRRQALLARWRPDLEPVDLRGNVPTRLRRLDEGRFDAVVLAAAGLARLGLEARIDSYLPPERFPPAVGQGALAIQARADDEETLRRVAQLDDPPSGAATTAERALLARLEGGCQIPVGALAEVKGDRLTLAAMVCALDGSRAIDGHQEGDVADAAAVGAALAEELLARGAGEIIAALRAR